MKRLQFAALCLLMCLLTFCSSLAEYGSWYVFSADSPPEEVRLEAMSVGGNGTVTVSMLGDCTLGTESRSRSAYYGFIQTVRRKGEEWPFGGLLSYLEEDDITLVNLECVLSDRNLSKVKKKFNFKGPTSMTNVLLKGSVECVTLENNHSQDYGERGLIDTKKALNSAGIAWMDAENVAVWSRDGILIGFTASSFTLSKAVRKTLKKQIQTLKDLGCGLIIHSMHAGREYSFSPGSQQKDVAQFVLDCGASVVVGHHPHVVQGVAVSEKGIVLYSLGNAVFGGNMDPDERDALMACCTFAFTDGKCDSAELKLIPVTITGKKKGNDYRPEVLDQKNAARVLLRVEESAGYPLPERDESGAAVIRWTASAPDGR